MILLAVTLSLFAQDPPPGEVVTTAPPPASATTLADPFARPSGSRQEPAGFEDLFGPSPLATLRPVDPERQADDFDRDFAASRGPRSEPTSVPLPAAAYEDPLLYAATACRTENRPAGEDIRACYARIESAVAAARPTPSPVRPRIAAPQRVRCENSQSQSDDGRTSSTSGRCSVGTGDPALLDDILGW